MLESGIKKMWRYHCITAFRQAHRSGQLRWQTESAFLKNYPCFNKLLSQLYELKWYVHIGAALLDPAVTVRYIGRYTKRAVLAEYRITHYDGKVVRFAYRDYAQDGKTSYKTLPVLAFIGRLIRHIPDKNFKMVRHAGLFAPRWESTLSGPGTSRFRSANPTGPFDATSGSGFITALAATTGGREGRRSSGVFNMPCSNGIGRSPLRSARRHCQILRHRSASHSSISSGLAAGSRMNTCGLGSER
jgi:hypothetical protein